MSMTRVGLLAAAALLAQACSRADDTPPTVRFKKGGEGREKAWGQLQAEFSKALENVPKTKADLTTLTEQWLGKSEPTSLQACEKLVVWAGAPQPMDGDVLAYLLSQDADGFRRFLVLDFRDPARPQIREASMTGPPSKKDDPHERITDAERAIAREIDAIPINLGGGSEDGSYKPGFRIWIQAGQGSEEILKKARALTTLVSVDLEGPQVTDAWLSPLEGHSYIGSIRLRSVSITDRGLLSLRKSTGLKWLTLEHCAVTPAAVQELQAALPKCEIRLNP